MKRHIPNIITCLNVTCGALAILTATEYDNHYAGEEYYWGLEPNKLCYEIMQRKRWNS